MIVNDVQLEITKKWSKEFLTAYENFIPVDDVAEELLDAAKAVLLYQHYELEDQITEYESNKTL